MAFTHLCSCDAETERILKEKALSPSECFRIGVRKLAFEEKPLSKGETIETETEKARRIKMQNAMQRHIDELNDMLDKEREEKNAILEKNK